MMRLKSVDLPTFGRPTMATVRKGVFCEDTGFSLGGYNVAAGIVQPNEALKHGIAK